MEPIVSVVIETADGEVRVAGYRIKGAPDGNQTAVQPRPLCRDPRGPGGPRAAGQSPACYLDRHLAGDWGSVSEEDRRANDAALAAGERLLSEYRTALGVVLWVITEADRSSTCVLLPGEY
ncbi:MAG: hypothetical protein JWO38_7376 [Gemmataceae bacterium]|nr:hypothetical protein [Gemmataceae bacterium]